MDKRAILAILLTALWLILWQAFFAPPPSKRTAASRPTPAAAGPSSRTFAPSFGEPGASPALPAGAGETPSASPAEETAGKMAQEAPPHGETVTVDTPLYHAELDTRGAVLTSFKLVGYRASCSDPESFDILTGVKPSNRPLAVDLWIEGGQLGKQVLTRDALFAASETSLRLAKGEEPRELSFEADVAGVGRVFKKVRFQPDRFSIGVEVKVEPAPEAPQLLGVIAPLAFERPPGVADRYNTQRLMVMGGRKPTDLHTEDLAKILARKVDPKKLGFEGGIRWAGFVERYFLRAVVASSESPFGFQAGPFDPGTVVGQGIVRASDKGNYTFTVYLGPKTLEDLEGVEKSLAKAVEFGIFGEYLPRFFLWMLKGFYRFTGNYGVGIIILTVLVRAAMFPLALKGLKSMKQMQKIQPEFKALREKFKDSPEKLNQEVMNLYKRYKINPLSGCLPMVLQLPVFLGLYYSLLNAVELRCAPFALWIQDLSQPDRLGALPIPFVSPPGIPVLTVLMGGTMFLQQKLTPMTGDPSQTKMLQWMPVIFTFMFLGFPSGLTIYWLFSNLVSVLQQLVINRMADRRVFGG